MEPVDYAAPGVLVSEQPGAIQSDKILIKQVK